MTLTENFRLKVIEAEIQDARKGMVRIPADAMSALGLKPNDVVAITGKRTTVARVVPGFPESCLPGCIQMDGVIRLNSGAGIGDLVELAPCEALEAKVIVLSPVLTGWQGADKEVQVIKKFLMGRAVIAGDQVSIPQFSGTDEAFTIEGTSPRGAVIITRETIVRIKGTESSQSRRENITYEDIGGLEKEIKKIREIVELPLKYPHIFHELGIEPPKGILLYGPPGTGKTLIARAIAAETEAHFILVNGPEIMNKYYGESEAKLRQVFEEAKKKAPTIIFLDEIDAIAPRRTEVHGDVEKRVVAQLLALMDGLEARGNVIVLAATNVPDLIDPALRRPGRFDREILIDVPDQRGRREILEIHTRGMALSEDVSLDRLAAVTHGFVGADLAALCREAGMHALQRVLEKLPSDSAPLDITELKVTMNDFLNALEEVDPSATREFAVELPSVGWEDIGGLNPIKERLKSLVQWPLTRPELIEKFHLNPPKGILLFGPPGTGKTLTVRALARESRINFIPVNTSLLFSRWKGQAEKMLHEVFRKARQVSPCILFFDELDALVPVRRGGEETNGHLVSQFLLEFDALEEIHQVIVIGATNRIDLIDKALLRPGRFDEVIEFPYPDRLDRRAIFEIHLRSRPLADDLNLEELSLKSEGFTGAEIEAVCRRAAFAAALEFVSNRPISQEAGLIRQQHLINAIDELKKKK
ncbi:CDC48 family AAA ATPase [Thermovenabulum sp.]|uniref:CDC48 family AAA ATPase n=1 Tax=Thermovenabulum sp. TaxID=3100335 RepID=UPI003C7CB11B